MSKHLLLSGVSGLVGVGLGAFGAHGLKEFLDARGTHPLWETAVFYQLVHTAALLAVSLAPSGGKPLLLWAARLWMIGIVLFSGSLYALALGGTGALFGPITPLGGTALLAGWACIVGFALKDKEEV